MDNASDDCDRPEVSPAAATTEHGSGHLPDLVDASSVPDQVGTECEALYHDTASVRAVGPWGAFDLDEDIIRQVSATRFVIGDDVVAPGGQFSDEEWTGANYSGPDDSWTPGRTGRARNLRYRRAYSAHDIDAVNSDFEEGVIQVLSDTASEGQIEDMFADIVRYLRAAAPGGNLSRDRGYPTILDLQCCVPCWRRSTFYICVCLIAAHLCIVDGPYPASYSPLTD